MTTTAHNLSDSAPAPVPADGKFDFALPMHVFEKADAPEGKKRRFGGICSTDRSDRQGERILQDGLDWGDFFEHGWFNDNHSSKTADVLGYGDKGSLLQFKPGDILPDGSQAQSNGTWVEGYLLNRPAADQIWDLAQSLQGTGRTLGFSVEGNIVKRTGADNKTIAKAKIRNIAITNCPVNTDARLEILARSLEAIEKQAQVEDAEKAMGGFGPPVPQADASGTGPTAGRIIATEALEPTLHDTAGTAPRKRKRKKKVAKKSMGLAEAIAYVQRRAPGISQAAATEIAILSKAGEGSRGGKVIGHTRNGLPIYSSGGHSAGYTPEDHADAAEKHASEAVRHVNAHVSAYRDENVEHLDLAEHHEKMFEEHARQATRSDPKKKSRSEGTKKALTPAQALSYFRAQCTGLSKSTANRMLKAASALQRAGLI